MKVPKIKCYCENGKSTLFNIVISVSHIKNKLFKRGIVKKYNFVEISISKRNKNPIEPKYARHVISGEECAL